MGKHLIDDFPKNNYREAIFIKNTSNKNTAKCTLKRFVADLQDIDYVPCAC